MFPWNFGSAGSHNPRLRSFASNHERLPGFCLLQSKPYRLPPIQNYFEFMISSNLAHYLHWVVIVRVFVRNKNFSAKFRSDIPQKRALPFIPPPSRRPQNADKPGTLRSRLRVDFNQRLWQKSVINQNTKIFSNSGWNVHIFHSAGNPRNLGECFLGHAREHPLPFRESEGGNRVHFIEFPGQI